MNIQTAIEKAIQGGWNNGTAQFITADRFWAEFVSYQGSKETVSTSAILLDPLFWKALIGTKYRPHDWQKISVFEVCKRCGTKVDPREEDETPCIFEWLFYQHNFIDSLAKGDSIEYFFAHLSI